MNAFMTWFYQMSSPPHFYRWAGRAIPWFMWPAVLLAAVAAYLGLWRSPEDYQMGNTVRIMYVHVPSAWLSMSCYTSMAIASAIGWIWRMKLAHAVAAAIAPAGAALTFLALVTGAIWGKPTWGTWSVWDARLTAVLIMFFFYLGYMALWAAIEEPEKAADLTAVLCLVGVIFAFLSRYAVRFWNTLHQDSSLSVEAGQRIDDAFRTPLYICMIAFYILFAAILLLRARTEIRQRRAHALRLQGATA